MCGNKDNLEGYYSGRKINWQRIHADTNSSDPEAAKKGREANEQLIYAGVLTTKKEGSWYFKDERMNPYSSIPDSNQPGSQSKKMGRVYFVKKSDAIAYGEANWWWRFDEWIITDGKTEITKSGKETIRA